MRIYAIRKRASPQAAQAAQAAQAGNRDAEQAAQATEGENRQRRLRIHTRSVKRRQKRTSTGKGRRRDRKRVPWRQWGPRLAWGRVLQGSGCSTHPLRLHTLALQAVYRDRNPEKRRNRQFDLPFLLLTFACARGHRRRRTHFCRRRRPRCRASLPTSPRYPQG